MNQIITLLLILIVCIILSLMFNNRPVKQLFLMLACFKIDKQDKIIIDNIITLI